MADRRVNFYIEINVFTGEQYDQMCSGVVDVWEGQSVDIELKGEVIASIREDGTVTYPERECSTE